MLKFRAWNKLTREMCQVKKLILDGNGCVDMAYLDNKSDVHLCEANEFVLMPAIGWKDIHDTEIYIDDLVYIFTPNCDEEDGLFHVVWDKENCCVAFVNDDIEYTGDNISGDNVEVVGNMFEFLPIIF